ncbi:acyl-CoA thioesterase [Desulfococcus multivorans]|uniref:Thioesterase n=2 Tax=Desulfococcus TaxID=896 RepID=S7U0L5_DESML|nr:thioesterase family protein [Desulfococcus multivorans]AOY59441.1 conserved uncharacterized protein related to thioesterase [Desulfococcus multivorans]AQV01646.1 hypothetical protein B2D07_13330 [Desulfococcus multivorans]EPR42862.1 thioesterase [Desulfococcus multivorans DSM 2059]SKA00823.1 acyl-CoA thioester hydrolase [Desulfococcus multivorans DSM 2059]
MQDFKITRPITVRIGEINYGNHVGYQHYLTYFQEARIAYLAHLSFTEKDIGGYGMMVSEATCRYRRELFLGDRIEVGCRITVIKSKAFVMEYRIEKADTLCASGSTTNICFDFESGKVVPLPEAFTTAVRAFEGYVL